MNVAAARPLLIPPVFVLAGFIGLFTSLPALGLTPSEVFSRAKDSIYIVRSLDAAGSTMTQGSAVLLPSGKVGTNCHVLQRGEKFASNKADGKQM